MGLGEVRVSKYAKHDATIVKMNADGLRINAISVGLNIPDWYVRKVLNLADLPYIKERRGHATLVLGEKHAHNFLNLEGRRFGKLVAVKFGGTIEGKRSFWILKCDCGNLTKANTCHLTQGSRVSCGCARKDTVYGWDLYSPIFASYRSSARRRNIQFELTKEQFIKMVSSNCRYCNSHPEERKYREGKVRVKVNGIDRKNPKIGYTLSNVLTCCRRCNYMKSDTDLKYFLSHVKKIYKNLLKLSKVNS